MKKNDSSKINVHPDQDSLYQQMHYWDSVALEKKFHATFDIELFLKYVNPTNTVLDFGCGYGRVLEKLIQHEFKYLYGMDFSNHMLELAKKSYPNVNFTQNIGVNISFNNEFFDTVILSTVLGCVAGDSQQKHLLKEIARVLKTGGILYLSDFLLNDDERNIERYEQFKNTDEYPYGVFQLPEGALLRHHTKEHINELLSTAFDIKILQRTVFATMDDQHSNGFIVIAQKKNY